MSFDAVFRSLASPARRRVLTLVSDQPRSVGDLAGDLGVSQPAVSQHLANLRAAGLVVAEPDGRRRLYRVDTDTVAELRGFVDAYCSSALDRRSPTGASNGSRCCCRSTAG